MNLKKLINFIILLAILCSSNCKSDPEPAQPVSNSPIQDGDYVSPGPLQGSISLSSTNSLIPDFDMSGPRSYTQVLYGDYTAPDGGKVKVFVSYDENGSIHTPLFLLPGETGSTGVAFISPIGERLRDHRVIFTVNLRGTGDSTSTEECVGDNTTLAECARNHSQYKNYNPAFMVNEMNQIAKILTSENPGSQLKVNGAASSLKSYLSANDDFTRGIDIVTGSYGPVFLEFMLKTRDRQRIRRIVIENPSISQENVISGAFDTIGEIMESIFKYCQEDTACNNKYPNLRNEFRSWVSMYHESQGSLQGANISQAYSEGVVSWVLGNFTNSLIDVPFFMHQVATGGSLSELNTDELEEGSPFSQVQNKNILGSIQNTSRVSDPTDFGYGQLQQVGLICSSFINRPNDPDTRAKYNQKLDSENSPWRYDFLIEHSVYLDICSATEIEGQRSPEFDQKYDIPTLVYYGVQANKQQLYEAEYIASIFHNSNLLLNRRGNHPSFTDIPEIRACLEQIQRDFYKGEYKPNCMEDIHRRSLSDWGTVR